MFTLTAFELIALGIGLLATIVVLVVGALRSLPRATRIVSTTVECPLLAARVSAEMVRDVWTLRFVDVASCAALGGCASVLCTRRCLAGRPVTS